MTYAVWLAPLGLAMGLVGLLAFLWSMKSGQLEDLDGAAERVLLSDAADRPLSTDRRGNHNLSGSGTSQRDEASEHAIERRSA